MKIDWQKVFESSIQHQAEITRGLLEASDIPAVVVDKKDSAYLIGYFEVHVPKDEVLNALRIIDETEIK